MSIAATLLLALFVFFIGGVLFVEGGAGHAALDARSTVVHEGGMPMVVLPESASVSAFANGFCEQGYVSNRWVEQRIFTRQWAAERTPSPPPRQPPAIPPVGIMAFLT